MKNEWRRLEQNEENLLRKIFTKINYRKKGECSLESLLVRDMDDGGMGSLLFFGPEDRKLGKLVCEGVFNDIDGIEVSFTINEDKEGYLFEFDSWKVNFEPLKNFPPAEDISFVHTNQEGKLNFVKFADFKWKSWQSFIEDFKK